jgi:hypothetical protein
VFEDRGWLSFLLVDVDCADCDGRGGAVGEGGGRSRFDFGEGGTQAAEEDGEMCPDFWQAERESLFDWTGGYCWTVAVF